jgi:staphylococcal nuclease domain-containing protein 1
VQFQVLYTIPTGAKREYGTVAFASGGENLPEAALSEGWVKLREDAGRREASEDAQTLLNKYKELEAQAKSSSKGLWATSGGQLETTYDIPDFKAFVEEWKGKNMTGVVERVLSGDRAFVRLILSSLKHLQTLVVIAGIRAPATKRTGPDGKEQPAEPLGEQSKLFVESRLLQRNVTVNVLGTTPQNQLIASLIHPNGNIAGFLLAQGLARCFDAHSTMLGGEMAALRQAEKSAKDGKKGLFTDHIAPKGRAAAEADFIVTRVLNADTLFIRNKANVDKKIGLSSIRQPKPSDPAQAPFAADAKEFLRKKIIGKHVKVTIDGKKAASEGYEEREVATVTQNGKNVALGMVEAGYASVIRHRQNDEDRSPEYDALLAAEETAKGEAKGMWSPKPTSAKQYQDYSENVQKAKMEASVLQRQSKIPAIVDFVKSGSRFTILIPRENAKLTLVLGGISAPRSARSANETSEPFGQEAHEFANRRCMQRDVEVDITGNDKVGGFIGSLYVNRENFAKILLEEGLAKVNGRSAEQAGLATEFYAAESKAKEARKGLWTDWDPSQDCEDEDEETLPTNGANGAESEPTERRKDYRDIVVTHVGEECKVKIQQVGTGTTALTELMNSFRTFHLNKSNDIPLSALPKAGEMVAAKFYEDGEWYRAKVRRNDRENKSAEVVYVDYGNSEILPWSRLRALSQPQFSVQKLKPQAVDAILSFVQFPGSSEYLTDAMNYLNERVAGRQLVANVDHTAPEGTLYLTLLEKDSSSLYQSVNAELVSEGLAMVPRKLKPWERGSKDALESLKVKEEEAKKARHGMWEYGDLTED